jgi:hypothetical protein
MDVCVCVCVCVCEGNILETNEKRGKVISGMTHCPRN